MSRPGQHVPALDGLRAVAVAAVLAFHLGYGWASGGFLGVSVFFTLSGYLITSLLVAEHRRSGGVRLGAFYRRRAARLLPASLLGLLLALVVGRAIAVGASDLRGDLLAALLQVANWRWLLESQSYAELFAAPSPVLHYWSLAIEEQFYLVFPPILAWSLQRGASALRRVVTAGLVGSWAVLVGLVAVGARDAAYYATPARLGEILAGALLACAVGPPGAARRIPGIARSGPPALVGLGLLVVAVTATGRWTYAWALPLTSLLTVVVIAASVAQGSRTRGWLAAAPLVALGRISYGVYVYHWPVFLYLTPARTGVSSGWLAALRLGVTLVLAVASHRLVEVPALLAARSSDRARRTPALAALAAGWLVVASVLAVGARPEPAANDFAALSSALDRPPAPSPVAPADLVAAPEPPTVAFFGDSTAAVTSLALAQWGEPAVDIVGVTGAEVPLGCGLELPGDRRLRGAVDPIDQRCFDRADAWASVFVESGARLAVVQSGVWETTDHRLPGDDRWRALGDPVLDHAYEERFLEAVDVLVGAGAERVVWLTSPALDVGGPDLQRSTLPEADRARAARYNDLVRRVASQRPQVVVVDLGAHVDGWSEDLDRQRRPDGIHLTDVAALEVVETWLGPALLEVFAAVDGPGSAAGVTPRAPGNG